MSRRRDYYRVAVDDPTDITPREILFCIFLFLVILCVGFPIASSIKRHENDKNLKYNQAVQITDKDEFEQAFETDIGNAFVEGDFSCEGVEYDKIDGKHLRIEITHQKYTEHTRIETYTTTDSKGRTQTHTKTVHYWSWDNVGHEEKLCHTVFFKGREFWYGNFNYATVPSRLEIVSTGYHKRDVVTTYPRQFNCTVFCNMRNRSFTDVATIYYEMDIERAHQYSISRGGVVVFWIFWTIFAIFVCGLFASKQNDWLEDR